jgi:class 3 adenylate cyclase/tetratricopeptide (TPR) repeat protein
VTCEACGSENGAGQKFCGECGTPLARSCPSGHRNDSAAKFCGECGAPLAAPATPGGPEQSSRTASSERRFITALFADLVGFTSMTEASDPEDVRLMLTDYFERARTVIERFGGEVDKFIGDAITAFWGTSIANEDDAERAVRAGLELVDLVDSLGEKLGLGLALRVGVLSGETAVGEGGNQQGLVIGDIVNTAARIQSAADPGTVYVGEATHRLTTGALAYVERGSIDAKGKSEPVRVWQAEAVVGQRGGVGRWDTLEPPFVGREDELRFLKDQLHATSRDGAARLVSIVGEPGIGKSRIAWELLKYVDGVTEAFKWHQGRSPAYGEGVTFWALAEMVRSRAGITDGDPATSARTRLRTCVAEYVPDPDERAWIEPKLASLLGLEDPGGVTRGELFSAIRTFFQLIAATATVVMLFEDLHWADSGQLEFIEELVELSNGSPILVITLSRPDILERRPDWGTARSNFASIHLGPLSAPEMNRLVRGLVPDADDDFVALVVGRAGGVPLYAVEFLRALVDAGSLSPDGSALVVTGSVADIALPDTLHAVIGSRLDRLEPADRSLLQDCAILGQSFTPDGLAALTGLAEGDLRTRLRELVRRELLRLEGDPMSPERGQYQFVQGVIREVAYGRIAKADRLSRHVKVAEYFERTAPIEAAAVIAEHCVSAFEIDADETLAARAREALVRAAERASSLGSYGQALALAERGLEVPGSGADKLVLRELGSKAASAVLDHERAIEIALGAVEWAGDEGTEVDRWRATHLLGLAYVEGDLPGKAMEVLEPAFDPSEVDHPEMAMLGSILSNAALRDARWELSAEVAVPVMVAAERSGDLVTLVEAMTSRGTVLPQLGRHHEGVALLRESLRLAGDTWGGLRALNNLLLYASVDGHLAVEPIVRRGVEVARRVGHAALTIRLMTWECQIEEFGGRFEAAVASLDAVDTRDGGYWEGAAAATRERYLWRLSGDPRHLQRGVSLVEPLLENPEPQYRDWTKEYLANAHWYLGDHRRARSYAEGLAEAPEAGLPPAAFHFRHVAVGVAFRERSIEQLTRAEEMDFERGRRRDSLLALVGIGRRVLVGEPVDRSAVDEVISLVEEVDGPLPAAEWKAELALLLDGGEPAAELATEARDWFASVGDLGSLGRYADLFAGLVPDAAVG